jgi:hypothetical protein
MICGQSLALGTPAISLNGSAPPGAHPDALPGNRPPARRPPGIKIALEIVLHPPASRLTR